MAWPRGDVSADGLITNPRYNHWPRGGAASHLDDQTAQLDWQDLCGHYPRDAAPRPAVNHVLCRLWLISVYAENCGGGNCFWYQ